MEIKDLFPIKKLQLIVITLITLFGCQGETIDSNSPELTFSNGKYYLKGLPFTGKIKIENQTMEEFSIASYRNGLEDGEYFTQKKSGQIIEERFFKEGLKQGIHKSWFQNGNIRLYSEFENGKYINDRWEWYDNGKPYIYEKYDSSGRIMVTKMWNRYGHIYMNIVYDKNGSSIGMPGSKICNPIKPLIKKEQL